MATGVNDEGVKGVFLIVCDVIPNSRDCFSIDVFFLLFTCPSSGFL